MTTDSKKRLVPQEVQSKLAKDFNDLHNLKSDILCLMNICDEAGIDMILEASKNVKPGSRQLQGFATASAGMAMIANTTDDELMWEEYAPLCVKVAKHLYWPLADGERMIPLSVDVQDGYGDDLENVIEQTILEMGAVGVNIEDAPRPEGPNLPVKLMSAQEASERITRVLKKARELGVPDFVVNARTDAVLAGESVDEAIRRGKEYFKAGATVVYVWGGPKRGLRTEEVEVIIRELNGRVNLKLEPGGLTLDDLTKMGAARVSLGPYLYKKQREGGKDAVIKIIKSLFEDGRI